MLTVVATPSLTPWRLPRGRRSVWEDCRRLGGRVRRSSVNRWALLGRSRDVGARRGRVYGIVDDQRTECVATTCRGPLRPIRARSSTSQASSTREVLEKIALVAELCILSTGRRSIADHLLSRSAHRTRTRAAYTWNPNPSPPA